jgi:hypothetical protein
VAAGRSCQRCWCCLALATCGGGTSALCTASCRRRHNNPRYPSTAAHPSQSITRAECWEPSGAGQTTATGPDKSRRRSRRIPIHIAEEKGGKEERSKGKEEDSLENLTLADYVVITALILEILGRSDRCSKLASSLPPLRHPDIAPPLD